MSLDGRRVVAETLPSATCKRGTSIRGNPSVRRSGALLPRRLVAPTDASSRPPISRETSWASGTSRRAGRRRVTRSPPRWARPQPVWRSTETGSVLATGFEDGTVKLWDTSTGNAIRAADPGALGRGDVSCVQRRRHAAGHGLPGHHQCGCSTSAREIRSAHHDVASRLGA